MPGERPHGAPPPATTRDLHPHQGAGGLQRPSEASHEDQPPSSRTAQATRRASCKALARDPPKAQPGQAREVEPQATLLRPRPLRGPPGKGGGPPTPPARSHPGAQVWLANKADSSPPQLYGLGIASPRAKPALDEPPEGWPREAPQDSQAEACSRPNLSGAEALPTPKELHSQRCFQEAPSSFTSSNYTSPSASQGPPRAPPSNGASPPALASIPELQASGASSWPLAAEDNFPGANFGVSPTESEPFHEGSRPGSPRGSPFPYPLQTQASHEDTAGQGYANGALTFSFHQPLGRWPEVAMGTSPAYPLPPTPSPLTCCPRHPGSLEATGDSADALSPPGAAPLAPRPFPDSLHKNLTEVLPERHPSSHEGLGSPRAPLIPGPQGHFPGQGYRANKMGSSPGPGDAEPATPRALPARLPQLWDPTAAPYPERPVHAPSTTGATFFDSPGQQLCLPQSPTVPWSPMLPSPGPSPHQREVLSQLPFPRGPPEWQEGKQGALGAANQMPGRGETLVALRTSPGQPGSSPGLLPYSGLKDPGAQALFFGSTQPQVSPRGASGLPPPRVVGVSPSESPLPSPATNTAGSSTCSSLSPLSSSPANPSSEDSQLPAPLGPSGFFLPAPQPQETGSPFQSPEPRSTGPPHFPLTSDGLRPEGALEFRDVEGHGAGREGLQGFPQGPATYATHHFPLSSASLDQLDVLLTCRQCDRNYSSLASFLEHRQFCSLLLARHGPQGRTTAPKAPAPTHPGLLGHSQTIPFLLAGDEQTEGKDDALRTSFLPSLAAPPFPLPASDLDLEDNAKLDDAKLDSLITEALNGMQDPSDSPEIDSSFIDVFADEDPPGLRGPGTGKPPSTRASATLEHHAQPLPPAGGALQKARAPCPEDRACQAQSEPNTPCLGPAPTEATAPSPGRQPRRGKQLKLFWKEVDAAHSAKGPGRAPCPRPRRRGRSAQQTPPHPRDLRTQAKGHMDPDKRVPRALLLPAETRNAKGLRLPPRKDPKKRRARRGSSWNKELIHKIVLQKNKLYRLQVPSQAQQGRLGDFNCTSESEEDSPEPSGPGHRGHARHGRRQQRLGRKTKEGVLGHGPSKTGRLGPGEDRGSPAPAQLHSPSHSQDRDPTWTGRPTGAPKDITTPEESHPPLGLRQAAQKPEAAEELPPDTAKLREVAPWERGRPRPPTAESPRPSRGDTRRPQPSESHPKVSPSRTVPRPAGSSLLGTPSHTESPKPPDGEDAPACQPRDAQTLAANPTRAAYSKKGSPISRSSDLGCSPAHFNGHSVGIPATHKGAQPHSTAPTELFLEPKDPAVDTPPVGSSYLGQDHVDPLEPKPPKNMPYAAEADPGPAQSPLTLESTSLFVGLPEDGFDPPLYDSLSPHQASPMPLACADPLPRKPLIQPLFPPFLLLEEVSPMLPSQFPDLSGPKPFQKKCPSEETAPSSPAPVPGKRTEYNAAFMSNLSEDELEIKRLVSELESQLQRREGPQGAPRGLSEAAHAATPMRACQATPPHSDVAHHTGPGECRPHGEGVQTVMSPRKGALGSPQGEQPPAAPPPGHHKDQASGAPLGPMGYSLSAQESGGHEAEGNSRALPGTGLPDPREHPEVPLEAGGSAEHSPGHDLLSPRKGKSPRTQELGGSPPPLAWEQSRGQRPATPTPDQGLWASGAVSLDVISASDASHSHASQGPAPRTRGPPGILAEGSALQGREGPSHRGPQAGLASSPSCPLQVLGARAEGEDGIQISKKPPPANAQSPWHRAPPGAGGDRVTGGSLGGMQDMAASTATEADTQLGSPGQAKKPKAQGKAHHGLPDAWWSTGAPSNSAKATALPGTPRLAGATAGLQGGSTASGLRERAQPAPGPQHPLETAACTQRGPEDRPLREVACPAPPTGGPTTATPAPCSLEHTPQEALPSMSLGGTSWPQAPVGAGDASPPSLMTSLCGLENVPPPTLLGASSPKDWPGLSNILTPTTTQSQDGPGSSKSRTLEDFRREPGCSLTCATSPRPGAPAVTKERDAEIVPTNPGVKAVGEPRVLDATSHPPCLTPHLGHRDGHSIVATHTDPTSVGCTQPCPFPCLEREAEVISEGQEDVGTGVTQVPTAGPQGLTATCSPPAASPSNGASDSGSKSPQSHMGVPHQMPQMDPLSSPDPKQKPYGFKKKPEPAEKGIPPVPCVTCEICSASFRSGPGLSRHKARKHRQQGGTTPRCRAPGKKSRRTPGKDRPSHTLMLPSHPAGPSHPQGSTAPEGSTGPETEQRAKRGPRVPDHPLNQQLHTVSLTEPGEAPKPRHAQPEANKLHPRQTERREGQRRSRGPRDSPSTAAPKLQENVGKGRAGRARAEQRTADRRHSKPSMATASCAPEGQQRGDGRPGIPEDAADDPGLGEPCAADTTPQKSPGDKRSPAGRADGVSPGELPKGRKGAPARGLWEPTVAKTSHEDPLHASAGEVAEDCAGARGQPGHSLRAGTLVLPAASSSDTGGTVLSGPQGLLDAPAAQGGDSPSVLDEDVSFAQLFPPGGRFARKKNPRVYGKRCRRLRCWPPTEALSQARGDPPPSAQLPTDLSDSGSLCLSCEDLWGNEPMELPEPWLLEGALSSSTPGLSLWALEPGREASCVDKTPPCSTSNDQAETIPELHRIPGAWQGLGLQVPPPEPPGDVSPEPPNLEREGYEEGLSRNVEDLEMVRTTLEAEDLCFPGPWEDPARGPSTTSTLDLQDREGPALGRKGSFKCRVCFRRFHGLGELDLHRLAHSAAPPPTCYMCVERRFGSRQLLREHLQEKHVQGQAGPWACGMCLKEVADIWMYNQHLREHAALFARKGQARRARGELSAGSGDEGASAERATPQRGAGGADGRGGEVAPRDRAEPAPSESPHGASTPPSVPGGDGRASPSPCPEPRQHSEPQLRVGPVHADCKDPSRDCHHCGKRFPKPFKLQRHLAVHSPQRVYLCPRCPRVYAAHRELRAHLGSAHGVVGPGADGPVSPGSPALPRLCPQAAPGTARAQESLEDTAGRPGPPTASTDPPPPALSPLPDAQPESSEGREPDQASERPEDEASTGSSGPGRQQAPHLASGKRGTLGDRGRCARDLPLGEPSLSLKEKQVSPCHVAPEGGTAGPSHDGGATKLGACQSASKPRPGATTSSRAPKLPGQPRKPTHIGSPAPGELAPGPENRRKPATPKARPRPTSQGSGGARPGTKTSGGSQPQPASGRLQSETAITPAKPRGPSQSPAPLPLPPRAQARGSPKGTQACAGPQEKAEGSEKRRKGPGPVKRESTGSSGRTPPAPNRPPRAPRKQATPSRVLPTKLRPSGQISKMRPQPWDAQKGEPGPGHQREVLSKAFPQARRGRSVPSTRPAAFRDHRTAESQSDLLSQLFGQRLTSFKIPLKKDTSE
ncbi:PREDICTED: zinc finger protein 469 [Chinchilla lanigera]|uniref:zinc finger protein 469 n=1 Tax=Chinchilla lanigera TaxID=34839 RepID=UPI00038EE6C0|nr:PREDICTED: zinc finger protein 469 [Chinchilla lanigera]